MHILDCKVFWISDLKKFGVTEDGEDFIGEVYRVYVENAHGDRWIHNQHFNGVRVEVGEEGLIFHDSRKWAIARCEEIIRAVQKYGKIDVFHWAQTSPAYGSDAFIEYGNEEMIAWERSIG